MKTGLVFFTLLAGAFGAGVQKLFEMKKWENCPGKKLIEVFVEVNQTSLVPNKIFYSGHLDVSEKVAGPLEISFETNRCDFAMEKCEKFSGVKLPGICALLKNANGPFSMVVKAFKPPLSCPLLPGKYESPNSVIDVSIFAPLPVDGYSWVSTVRASSGDGKNRKLAMCLIMETKISMFRSKKGKK